MRNLEQPDLSHFREPETVGDRVCNWLAYHPRWTCFGIVVFCLLCGQVDWIAP